MRETLVKTEEFEDSPVEKIPKDWEIVSLRNEINILHGYAFKGEYFADEPPGNVLLVPGNFHRDGGLYFDDNNTKYYRASIPDGTVLENGELLIVMTDLSPRTLILGRVVQLQLPFRVLHNQRIGKIVLKLPDTWDKRFLLLVINSDRVRRNIISNATGTTVRHTSPDRILANLVPKPPVEEQSKIADIFDTIDIAIAHTSSLIAKLKQMKAGLLHDLLTRGLDENGELRDAIGHPEQFKDSPLGQIPKEWEVRTMEEITTKIVDGVHKTPVYVESGIPFLTVENLTAGIGISLKNVRYVTPSAHAEFFKRADPRPGDVLVSKDGTLGIARIVTDDLPEFSIFVSVAQLRPSEALVLPSFICTFFETGEYERQLGHRSAGTGLKHIHLEHFRAFQLAVPPIAEQHRISKVLNSHDIRIRTEEAYRDKLKLQKKGLMHDLLTGKVRVKDVDKFTSASDTV